MCQHVKLVFIVRTSIQDKTKLFLCICAVAFRNTFDEFVIFPSAAKAEFQIGANDFHSNLFSIEITDSCIFRLNLGDFSKKKVFWTEICKKEGERIVLIEFFNNESIRKRFFS